MNKLNFDKVADFVESTILTMRAVRASNKLTGHNQDVCVPFTKKCLKDALCRSTITAALIIQIYDLFKQEYDVTVCEPDEDNGISFFVILKESPPARSKFSNLRDMQLYERARK